MQDKPHIAIINGPNLNLLGIRQPEIYGFETFDDYFPLLTKAFPLVHFTYFQSNSEGELINELHRRGFESFGIVLNAGGYTHTSVAIADAVAAITAPVIEVHVSNVFARESFRQTSVLTRYCKGLVAGLGLKGYELAIRALLPPVN
jgi:3-dehydroquinate dehydratase-2